MENQFPVLEVSNHSLQILEKNKYNTVIAVKENSNYKINLVTVSNTIFTKLEDWINNSYLPREILRMKKNPFRKTMASNLEILI